HQSGLEASRDNATPERQKLLKELKAHLRPAELLAEVNRAGEQAPREDSTLEVTSYNQNSIWENTANTSQVVGQMAQPAPRAEKGYQERAAQQSKLQNDGTKNIVQKENRTLAGNNFFTSPEAWFGRGQVGPLIGDSVSVSRGPLLRLWLTTADQQDRLVAARLVRVGERGVCQGFLLDWNRLQRVLADEVKDSLPDARFEPMRESPPVHPERTMINLPIEVVPGTAPLAIADPGWTPLRVGLALAWAAAL